MKSVITYLISVLWVLAVLNGWITFKTIILSTKRDTTNRKKQNNVDWKNVYVYYIVLPKVLKWKIESDKLLQISSVFE